MAYKMKGMPYDCDNTPIYSTDMEDNVLGMAQNNGTILINKNVSPLELKKNKLLYIGNIQKKLLNQDSLLMSSD